MRFIFLFVAQMFALTAASADTTTVPGWECSRWADGSYYLYCGGAVIGHYTTSISCIDARKQICGVANSDYECRKWPDETYYLYCGTAYVGHYKSARECVAGKRSICD